jgi:hypothetical protein
MRRINPQENDASTAVCPFRAQTLEGSPLIRHYQAYFSTAYAELKRIVADMVVTIEREHGGDVPASFERAVRVAVERRQFWSRFCEVPELSLDTATILSDWTMARDAVAAQLTAKRGAPLESMTLSRETRALVDHYNTHRLALVSVAMFRDGRLTVYATMPQPLSANAMDLRLPKSCWVIAESV